MTNSVENESVDILNIREKGKIPTSGTLKDEIVDGLIGTSPVESVREQGLPDVRWTKSFPAST